MLQSVSLSVLESAAANPRRKIDRKSIEGLAASIKTDGVLHNLVVSPVKGAKGTKGGKKERYQIVSGWRRFEALRLLQKRGELPDDFTVAVEIRDDLSKDDTLRIATVENLQRQNLTPLEEAAALTKLVHKGVRLDDVVAQTGLSATTIKRRLALNSLCKEAKAALSKGGVTLSQAEALTLGSDEAQQRILEQMRFSLTPEETSALTGIGLTSVREAIGAGALGAKRHKRRVIVLPDEIKAWLRSLPDVKAGDGAE